MEQPNRNNKKKIEMTLKTTFVGNNLHVKEMTHKFVVTDDVLPNEVQSTKKKHKVIEMILLKLDEDEPVVPDANVDKEKEQSNADPQNAANKEHLMPEPFAVRDCPVGMCIRGVRAMARTSQDIPDNSDCEYCSDSKHVKDGAPPRRRSARNRMNMRRSTSESD